MNLQEFRFEISEIQLPGKVSWEMGDLKKKAVNGPEANTDIVI